MTTMQIHASISEDNGISALSEDNLDIYSVGISTGGIAEIRMVEMNPKRHIVATTIDEKGVAFAKEYIAKSKLERQIEAKIEDVTKPLPYSDDTFDFAYARLVLHYLPEQGLINALSELHRILKPGGKLFVVVRSAKCPDALRDDSMFDPTTHLTTYTYAEEATGKKQLEQRFFHTEESISKYARDASFNVQYTKPYDEHLYVDFMRTVKSPVLDNVIELLAVK